MADWTPSVELKTVKANNALMGYETTQEMMRTYQEAINETKKVVAAINGDFYKAGGVPVHSQLIDGEILKMPVQRDALAMDDQQHFYLGSFRYFGQLEILKPSIMLEIDGVNMAREADQLIVYNSYYGDSTNTNSYGYEVLLEQLEHVWLGPVHHAFALKHIGKGHRIECRVLVEHQFHQVGHEAFTGFLVTKLRRLLAEVAALTAIF